jgi:hypothetical protein
VLRPGGKLAVSDIVTDGPLPEVIKSNLSAWAGCIAGALDVKDYIRAIEGAGFDNVQVTPSFWDQEVIDSAIKQIEPKFTAKPEKAERENKAVLAAGDGIDGDPFEVEARDDFADFDPQKAIYSAKITAIKP